MLLKNITIKSTAKRVLKEIIIAVNEFRQEYPNMPIETILQSEKFLNKLAIRGLGGEKICTAVEIVQEIPNNIDKGSFNLTFNIVWNIVKYELKYDPTIGTNEDVETTIIVVKEFLDNLIQNETPSGVKEYLCPILNARFVLIPDGTFMMGSPEDEPGRSAMETLHHVTISKPFYMQTTEVTQGQWKKVMGENPSRFKGDDNLPVEQVSWNDVQEFIGKLNKMEGNDKYRLPTEAQWEYSCRAGSSKMYCFGDDHGRLGEYAWHDDNSGNVTHPVGRKKPNAWGLYDMYGNVWEWVQDWGGSDCDYPSGHVTDPTGPSSGPSRVFRGGSGVGCTGSCCRTAVRAGDQPDSRFWNSVGFRLIRTC